MGEHGPLIGAIDEGTSSARFLIFSSISARVIASYQIEISSIYPQEGWVEQDPVKILHSVQNCITAATGTLQEKNIDLQSIVAVGITNQRETTVVWDKLTGEPLHNAIVWLDTRTSSTLEYLLEKVPNKNKSHLQRLCGLPLSPYFSALKIKWLIENVPKVRLAIREGRCCFGTMDTWLIWNFTGGTNGGLYITDATNASRTMLMNIETLQWDPILCNFFDINIDMLPDIRSSSEIYGRIADGVLKGIPLSGCLGDQQAALVGQMCLHQGQAKCTYGTGCFLLYNTGTKKVDSSHGLLTTVAYRMGKTAAPVYALEGSVAVAGAAFGWLRDNIKLVKDLSEAEPLAQKVSSSGDVYFVPAFSGLYAPYWQPDARGVICGISEETSRTHIVRAALEAVCFQTRDILEAMNKDCGIPLTKLQVDGGMTTNNLLMQLQADLIGITVLRPKMAETTALGAAMAAGNAEGINVWDLDSIKPIVCDPFCPMITENGKAGAGGFLNFLLAYKLRHLSHLNRVKSIAKLDIGRSKAAADKQTGLSLQDLDPLCMSSSSSKCSSTWSVPDLPEKVWRSRDIRYSKWKMAIERSFGWDVANTTTQ